LSLNGHLYISFNNFIGLSEKIPTNKIRQDDWGEVICASHSRYKTHHGKLVEM